MIDLVKEFKKIDIKAENYLRAPIHKNLFSISPIKDKYKIWAPDPTKIEISTDKNFQQAVINIEEGIVPITERISQLNYNRGGYILPKRLLNNTRYFIPNTRKTYKVIKKTQYRDGKPGETIIDVTHVPNSKDKNVTLLTGYDETSLFVAALPKKVREVAEAHEFLKPKEVTNNSLRQGEFFLVPCKLYLCKILDNKLKNNFISDVMQLWKRGVQGRVFPLEPNSKHYASLMVKYKGDNYVLGSVFDSRKGRHNPVILKEWHKVVRNKEIKVPAIGATRTWD